MLRQLIEILLTTGLMALIMSGSMLAYNLGFNANMLKVWATMYPIAWAIAIPGIFMTRKFVRALMGMLFTTSPKRS